MKAIQVKIICNIWVKSRYIWLSKRNHDHSRIWFIHNYSDDFFYLLYTFPSFCRKLTTSRTPAALKSRHDTTLSAQLQERSFRKAAYINKDSRTNPPIAFKKISKLVHTLNRRVIKELTLWFIIMISLHNFLIYSKWLKKMRSMNIF